MDTLGWIEVLVRIAWLAAAVSFVPGLVRVDSPPAAPSATLLPAPGRARAIGATAVLILSEQLLGDGLEAGGWVIIVAGIALGGGGGLYAARSGPTAAGARRGS